MKTNLTICVDGEIKEPAMKIIQNKMNTTLSSLVNNMLKKIISKEDKNGIKS